MSFPLSVLSSSNRKLIEQVERLTKDINQFKYSCEDHRNVISLLRTSKKNVERECGALQHSLLQSTKESENLQSQALALTVRLVGEKEHTEKLSVEIGELERNVKQNEELAVKREEAIRQAVFNSLITEREVKEILDSNLVLGAKNTALDHKNRKGISSRIFVRLQEAQLMVQQLELELSGCSNEYQHVIHQQSIAKETLFSLIQDRNAITDELNALQKEAAVYDGKMLQNASIMKDLQTRIAEKVDKKIDALQLCEKLQQKQVQFEKKKVAVERQFDKLVCSMRQVLQELMQQAKNVSMQRRMKKNAKKKLLIGQSSANNATICWQEQMELLHSLQAEKNKITECLDNVSVKACPSPSLFLDVRATVQNRLLILENREYRTREKIDISVCALRQESELTDNLNARILCSQKAREKLKEDFSNFHARLTSTRSLQQSVEMEINAFTSALNQIAIRSKEAISERAVILRSELMQLRKNESVEMDRYRQLQRSLNAVKAQICSAVRLLMEDERKKEDMKSACLVLNSDVLGLEKELDQLRQVSERQKAQQKSMEVARRVLAISSQKLKENLVETVVTEELLKGEVVVQEAELEAEHQRLLVALNLEKNNLAVMKENFNRAQKNLGYLIMRYKGSLESLARFGEVNCLPCRTDSRSAEASTGFFAADVVSQFPDEISPEELHARFLLQQSCERESTLARGNYLDSRIVRLSKEVDGLKKILATLRGPISERQLHSLSQRKPLMVKSEQETVAELYSATEMSSVPHSTSSTGEPAPFPLALDVEQLEACEKDRTALLKEELNLYKEFLCDIKRQERESLQSLRDVKEKLKSARCIHQQKRAQLAKLHKDARKLQYRELPSSGK